MLADFVLFFSVCLHSIKHTHAHECSTNYYRSNAINFIYLTFVYSHSFIHSLTHSIIIVARSSFDFHAAQEIKKRKEKRENKWKRKNHLPIS